MWEVWLLSKSVQSVSKSGCHLCHRVIGLISNNAPRPAPATAELGHCWPQVKAHIKFICDSVVSSQINYVFRPIRTHVTRHKWPSVIEASTCWRATQMQGAWQRTEWTLRLQATCRQGIRPLHKSHTPHTRVARTCVKVKE